VKARRARQQIISRHFKPENHHEPPGANIRPTVHPTCPYCGSPLRPACPSGRARRWPRSRAIRTLLRIWDGSLEGPALDEPSACRDACPPPCCGRSDGTLPASETGKRSSGRRRFAGSLNVTADASPSHLFRPTPDCRLLRRQQTMKASRSGAMWTPIQMLCMASTVAATPRLWPTPRRAPTTRP